MTEEEFDKLTIEHIDRVKHYLNYFLREIIKRGENHDASKLKEPERSGLMKYTPKLKDSTYGSEEYNVFLKELSQVLNHHYTENRHHPEYFENGIRGMTLIDLVELISDWKAASERHVNGNIFESIEINQKRFGYSDELKEIFLNTAKLF